MKYIPILIIAFLTLAACQSSNSSAAAETTTATSPKTEKQVVKPMAIPPKQFAEKMASITEPQLIDVRTADEYKAGFIEGAQNIDFYSKTFLQDFKAQVDVKRPVFVYCKSGGRSGKTALMMSKSGYQEVYDLSGGYIAWMKAQQNQLPADVKAEEQ